MFGIVVFYIVAGIVALYILYFVIRTAVRDGIILSQKASPPEEKHSGIAQTTCPNCNKTHDIDYPKCPHCKHITEK